MPSARSAPRSADLPTRLVNDPRRPVFVFGPDMLRGLVDVVLAASTAHR